MVDCMVAGNCSNFLKSSLVCLAGSHFRILRLAFVHKQTKQDFSVVTAGYGREVMTLFSRLQGDRLSKVTVNADCWVFIASNVNIYMILGESGIDPAQPARRAASLE